MFLGARLKIVALLVENASYVKEHSPQSRQIHFLNKKVNESQSFGVIFS